ncbi:MAG: cytochrome P450, partial [Bryobacteraceae bacterium]
IYHCRFIRYHVYFLNRPDYIEQVLIADHRKFIKGRALQANRELFGNGLLTSEGEFWQRQRKLSQPAFHRERIAAYGATMVARSLAMLDTWKPGEERDVHQEMMALTLDIAARTLFDVEIAPETARIGRALGQVMEVSARPERILKTLRLVSFRSEARYRRGVKELDEIVFGMIRERRASTAKGASARGDLLSMLLAARDDDGKGMSDQQLRDEVLTLLLAGHETTAIALSWAWYLLSQNPEARAKLHAELAGVLAGRPPEFADLPRLPYTERVIKESLRLYPPAYIILRLAIQDCAVGGYTVPRGSSVGISPWVMHRLPKYFPDPLQFNPDRWTEEFTRCLPRFAYFPFGGGPRVCIGSQFAMMEAVLILATVAQRFSFALVPGHRVEMFPSITLRPKNGIPMRLHAAQTLAAACP